MLSCGSVDFKQTDMSFKPGANGRSVVLYNRLPSAKYRVVGIVSAWGKREKLEDKLIKKAEDIGADGLIELNVGKKVIINYSGYSEEYNEGGKRSIPMTVPLLSAKAIVFER